MSSGPAQSSRRSFLQGAAAYGGWTAALARSQAAEPPTEGLYPYATGGPAQRPRPRPKLAAIATKYHYLSHAYHIVGRFLDGFMVHDGTGFHRPDFEIASLFVEQTPATDLGRGKAKRHGVRFAATIAEALTLGTEKLAVDGVLLIAEHGDYPFNDKLQKLYPRARFFNEVMKVYDATGGRAPLFIDKHLSYDRTQAFAMLAEAKKRHIPLMAGSSLPVTYRLPAIEPPLGWAWKEAVVASRGEVEIFGFHALESLQCMVERRDRKGKPQGTLAVTCLEGDAIWNAGDNGLWSWELLNEALSRSHTRNPGDIRQNTKDFDPPPNRPTMLEDPVAFLVEYADGFRGTAMLLNGHVDDTTIAARVVRPEGDALVSTLFYLPAPPGADFFTPLVLRLEDFFRSQSPPYPVERTLLTGGILDAALESRHRGHVRIPTPDLANIDYQAPADSGFLRAAVAAGDR